MSQDDFKPLIKAAYLLQLRHGPFTPREFSECLGVVDVSHAYEQLVEFGILGGAAEQWGAAVFFDGKGTGADQSGSGWWCV